jgi:hypothetical protein
VLHHLGQMHVLRWARRAPACQLSPCNEFDLVGVGDSPGWLDGHEEREQDQLAHDPPGCGVDHEGREPELCNSVDDGFVRIQVRVPRRPHRLVSWGIEMPDPTIIEVQHDSFE